MLFMRGQVTIRVYDVTGRLIRCLLNEDKDAGVYAINWDATDDSGRIVPSGTYFLRLETEHHTATRKMCVVR
jgi:flagellar hook assembly protein FlgD